MLDIDPTNMKNNEPYLLGQILDQKSIIHPDISEEFSLKSSQTSLRKKKYVIIVKYKIIKIDEHHARVFIKIIGRGGQGDVYVAGTLIRQFDGSVLFKKNPQHQRIIKEESHLNITSDELAKRKQILSRARHLHAKFSFFEDENITYTAMFHFKGKSLADLIAQLHLGKIKISNQLCFEITRKILLAVKEQIHDRKLIHLDLKPSNILIDINLEKQRVIAVNIIDVDIATLMENPTSGEGSLQYLAPENFDENKNINAKADVYTLAITLGELFECDPKDILRPGMQQYFSPVFNIKREHLNSGICKGVATALEKMSVIDPTNRLDLDESIKDFELLELEEILISTERKELKKISDAYEEGKKARNVLLNLSETYLIEKDFDRFQFETNKSINHSLAKIANEPNSINVFTKMLGIYLLNDLNTVDAIINKIKSIFLEFRSNLESLNLSKKNFPVTADEQIKSLTKKSKKVATIEEINDFNNLFTLVLKDLSEQDSFKEWKLNQEISNAATFEDLKQIFDRLLSSEFEFLMKEKVDHNLFSKVKHGFANTRGFYIEKLQAQALRLLSNELASTSELISDLEFVVLPTGQSHIFEKYKYFFAEKTRLFSENPYQKKFEEMMSGQVPKFKSS